MKKIFYFLFLTAMIAVCTPAKAVLVNIPDANFRAKLQTLYPTCFVGAQMETTCSGVTSAIILNVNSLNIVNLSGIEYFTGLKILYCGGNTLKNLPTLPATLQELYCSYNQLITCSAPPNLQILECQNNQLISLPTLPASLQTLDCRENKLISLPTLPNSLQFLNCIRNKLTSLPTLPNSLKELYSYNNQLTSLPTLPANLELLNCFNNKLTSLPELPASLTSLGCDGNQLTSLPMLPASLVRLYCTQNQLITLPPLPANLIKFWCSNNQLTSLPTLPANLNFLGCENNFLDFADLEAISQKPSYYSTSSQSYNILPASQSLAVGETLTISGTIGGSNNTYQWYKNDVLISGAISAIHTKTNTASTDTGIYKCVVKSTYVGAGTTTGVIITSRNVEVCVGTSIASISTLSLPNGVWCISYEQTFAQIGLTGAPTWSVIAGVLPNGLFLNGVTGTISGVAEELGTFIFTIKVTNGCVQTKEFSITISENPTTSTDNTLSNAVKVSPNPSNGDFSIDFGSIDMNKSLVRVYDAQGKTVFSSENNTNLMTISLEKFANGIYLLEVQTEKTRIMKRLAKQ